ncbi:carbohydrate ABC transporter permease [Rubrimonas sp.]|uniref:carbohydrate ABC transporter permease n=1 Tax=Rubrimonas sp. TaxID=2036015 RepID=UPI002FDD6328
MRPPGAVGWTVLAAATAVALFPFFWMALTSLKPVSLVASPDVWIFAPTLENWRAVIGGSQTPRAILNSALVGVATVAIALLVACPGAYAISRFKASATTRLAVIAAELIPPSILIVPLFLAFHRLGLNGTLPALVVAHLTFVAPIVTWFLIGFFDEVPRALEEQAMIDGCTRAQAFRRVVLPAVAPGVGAAAIFGFVLSWNDLFYALILTGGANRTLPVTVAGFSTFRGVDMGGMAVAVLVAMAPVLVASFWVQSRLIRGMGGGVKG